SEWDKAAAAYTRALDLLPDETLKYGRVIPLCADMVRTPQVFDRLVRLRPHDPRPWVARGASRAAAGDLRAAADDLARAAEVAPDLPAVAYLHAVFRLAAGDREGCLEASRGMLRRYAASGNEVAQNVAVWVWVLAPQAEEEPLRLARALADHNPNNWPHQHNLAAALYRAGRYEESLEQMRK